MNTLIKITLSISLFFLGFNSTYAQWGKDKITGNGNVTTETVSTSDYSKIAGIGSVDVHLERGTEGNIRVTTDSNLQQYVIVEVVDGTLKIRTKKNVYLKTKKGIHVYVPFTDISAVSLTGSGDIDSKDTIQATDFAANVTGSGDVTLDVEAQDISAKVTGSGDLELSGSTDNLEVTVTGSGDFDGGDLQARSTDAKVAGSGDAEVNASEYLKARVSGSGDISYGGNPAKRDTKVAGSGTISSN